MNCRVFRRWLMIDPKRREEQFLQHWQQCPECAREAEQILELEKKLLAAIDVEPLKGALASPPPSIGLRRWALAASLLLALGVSVWLGHHSGLYPGMQPELSLVVLEHIKNEPKSLREERNVSARAVGLTLSTLGARLTADPGPVHYMEPCHIGKRQGLHLVLPGTRGPITVLLMPGEPVSERTTVDTVNFSGAIVPTEYGSMAVVGERREPVEAVIEKMRNAVAWSHADKTI